GGRGLAAGPRLFDGAARGFRNAVRLIKRQPMVEISIARRRYAGGVRDRGKLDAGAAHVGESPPVESEASGRRLECDRRSSDRRPDIPDRQRRRQGRGTKKAAWTPHPPPDDGPRS